MNKTTKETLQLSIENIVNQLNHLHKDQVYHKLNTKPFNSSENPAIPMSDKEPFMLGWVKGKKTEEIKGISVGALRKKREAGFFIEGLHWRKAKDNVIYYHFEAIDRFMGEK
jgi:hypothetical protein